MLASEPLPAPEKARVGRDLQRYSADGERLLAGCIPIRVNPAKDGMAAVQVLLVSSRGGKGLVFPKGGWETDEDVEAAAARETVEEAGVRGRLEMPMLGRFRYVGKPDRKHSANTQVACVVHMFVMHVAEELRTWPEQEQRQRHWCSVEEACAKCRHDWMREALLSWLQQRGWSLPPQLPAGAQSALPQPQTACNGQLNGLHVAS
ncbi:g4353 [Coccomyxa elongata]